jgi:L-alanine-DL-glutamate epimerase-like enolase superfamily enzyme
VRVTGIETWRVEMRLEEPYTIAYETIETTTNIFLRMITQGGITGLGCAAPDLEVCGETPEGAEEAFSSIVAPALRGRDPLQRLRLLESLGRRLLPDHPSVLAAVDMALHDLLGKVAGQPTRIILGGFRRRILAAITIGIDDEALVAERARELVASGIRALKLKGGRSVDADVARVRRVREIVGPRVQLRFDANQGYGVEDALRFIQETRPCNLELLEQPTPRRQPDLLGAVTRGVGVPVMADESLMSLRDAFRIARRDLADMVNVKLQKVGGIEEARRIDSVARAARLETMVGCMDEAGLAIAAGLHFALAHPNVAYADLDGHIGLVGDPTASAVTIRDGYLEPAPGPGLGVTL